MRAETTFFVVFLIVMLASVATVDNEDHNYHNNVASSKLQQQHLQEEKGKRLKRKAQLDPESSITAQSPQGSSQNQMLGQVLAEMMKQLALSAATAGAAPLPFTSAPQAATAAPAPLEKPDRIEKPDTLEKPDWIPPSDLDYSNWSPPDETGASNENPEAAAEEAPPSFGFGGLFGDVGVVDYDEPAPDAKSVDSSPNSFAGLLGVTGGEEEPTDYLDEMYNDEEMGKAADADFAQYMEDYDNIMGRTAMDEQLRDYDDKVLAAMAGGEGSGEGESFRGNKENDGWVIKNKDEFRRLDPHDYDTYVYGDLDPKEEQFSTADIGDYEYTDSIFGDYYVDAETNEETLKAMRKVWDFNKLHPGHPGYKIVIHENRNKSTDSKRARGWRYRAKLKELNLKKEENEEFWYHQQKYYKTSQFCEPSLPCTFRGQLPLGKNVDLNDPKEPGYTDGRNILWYMSGQLSKVMRHKFDAYEASATSFFKFSHRSAVNVVQFKLRFRAGVIYDRTPTSSGIMKRSPRGIGTDDIIRAINASLTEDSYLGKYQVRLDLMMLAVSDPLLKSNRKEPRIVGDGSGGPYFTTRLPKDTVAWMLYIILYVFGSACFGGVLTYFFAQMRVGNTLKQLEIARFKTAHDLKKKVNEKIFIWTKPDVAFSVYQKMEAKDVGYIPRPFVEDKNDLFTQIILTKAKHARREVTRQRKNQRLRNRFLAMMPAITDELKAERKARNAPNAAAAGMNFVRSTSLRLSRNFKAKTRTMRSRRLDLISRSFRMPKNRDWSKVFKDDQEPRYEVIVHHPPSTEESSLASSSPPSTPRLVSVEIESSNTVKFENECTPTKSSESKENRTKFERQKFASKSLRLPKSNSGERKVTFDHHDDMAVINSEEPVTYFNRTPSVRLPSLAKRREDCNSAKKLAIYKSGRSFECP